MFSDKTLLITGGTGSSTTIQSSSFILEMFATISRFSMRFAVSITSITPQR